MRPTPAAEALAVRHVVVPLDGSALAAAALPTSRALADRFGADLSMISVARDTREARELLAHVHEQLEDVAEASPADAVVVVSSDPAKAIRKRVEEREGTLLVLSTRGRGRLSGAAFGSVAGDVLASTDVPFVAVGPNADRPGWLVGRPRRRPSRWRRPATSGSVVALVDGTPESETALPVAAQWATALDTELVVLTVAEDVPARLDGTTPNRFGPARPAAYVEDVAERWQLGAASVRGEVVADPLDVASGVKGYLADNDVALVVLAATRRTGLDRVRQGATAADVVRASDVPAVIVPLTARTLVATRSA
jgi:nucleotide-binding universal stress UspA family protein